jgi:hypothetical protein
MLTHWAGTRYDNGLVFWNQRYIEGGVITAVILLNVVVGYGVIVES